MALDPKWHRTPKKECIYPQETFFVHLSIRVSICPHSARIAKKKKIWSNKGNNTSHTLKIHWNRGSVSPFIHMSIDPSVCPSVCPLVTHKENNGCIVVCLSYLSPELRTSLLIVTCQLMEKVWTGKYSVRYLISCHSCLSSFEPNITKMSTTICVIPQLWNYEKNE